MFRYKQCYEHTHSYVHMPDHVYSVDVNGINTICFADLYDVAKAFDIVWIVGVRLYEIGIVIQFMPWDRSGRTHVSN